MGGLADRGYLKGMEATELRSAGSARLSEKVIDPLKESPAKLPLKNVQRKVE